MCVYVNLNYLKWKSYSRAAVEINSVSDRERQKSRGMIAGYVIFPIQATKTHSFSYYKIFPSIFPLVPFKFKVKTGGIFSYKV
jgi:hypothetical protein